MYLPRTSDLSQLAKYAPEDRKLEVTHYCLKGASKVCETIYLLFLVRWILTLRHRLCAFTSGTLNSTHDVCGMSQQITTNH